MLYAWNNKTMAEQSCLYKPKFHVERLHRTYTTTYKILYSIDFGNIILEFTKGRFFFD